MRRLKPLNSPADKPADKVARSEAPDVLGRKNTRRGGRKAGVPNRATAEVKALALVHGPGVIRRLAKICMRSKNELACIAAGRELLDRGFGRPVAAVELTGANGTALFDSMRERAAAIKELGGLSERELIARFKEAVNPGVRNGRQSGSSVH